MKKLGLCVRYDCDNFGSMLQILATQKAIEKCGWQYEIIRYDKKTLGFMIRNFSRVFNPYFMRGKMMGITKKLSLKKHPEIEDRNSKRLALFREYRKRYIGPYSSIYKGFDRLAQNANNYDAVMVGSDQLWTPAGLMTKFYNLLFVPDNVRKISLATSFGVTEIPQKQVGLTKQYLNRIDFLSVREVSGQKLIEKLTGREAVVAVDPTLLFDGEEWLDFFDYVKQSEEPYIFAYFLGNNNAHRDAVEQFAKKKNLKVITCPHMDEFVERDMTFGDDKRFEVSPVDFLNLVRGAEYIITDSFHGTVFSILNHNKFLTLNRYSDSLRKSKNTRIDSLFSLLGIENRHYISESLDIEKSIEADIDYVEIDKRLSDLRDETFHFLKKSLS